MGLTMQVSIYGSSREGVVTPPTATPIPQYPEGYLEAQAAKKSKEAGSSEEEAEEEEKPKKRGRKRKSTSGDLSSTPASKQPRFELSKQQLAMVRRDTANKKLWEELLEDSDTVSVCS